jgi:hypothetical protein
MFCVGCGEPLNDGADACACGTPAVGARFAEEVVVADGARVRTPWVCCCCLGPTDGVDDQSFVGSSLTGSRRFKMKLDIPWCERCRATRRRVGNLSLGVAAVVLLSVWLVASKLGQGPLGFAVGLVVALFSLVAVASALPGLLPSLREAGHVPGCAAMRGSVTATAARLTFHNRGFARIWRDFAATGESAAPSLRWAKLPVPDRPVDPVKTAPGAQAEGKLRASALRQQAREALRPAPVAIRRGGPAGPAAAGADAIGGLLRFTAKECHFTDAGLEARLSAGGERTVAWADVARVCVRQMPPAPPFGGALLLDLVLADGGVLRLLASTRGNFGALPGAGITSQENFRRLAAHVRARHPAAEIEPQSAPFLQDGKAPPRFDALARFEEYDARYG